MDLLSQEGKNKAANLRALNEGSIRGDDETKKVEKKQKTLIVFRFGLVYAGSLFCLCPVIAATGSSAQAKAGKENGWTDIPQLFQWLMWRQPAPRLFTSVNWTLHAVAAEAFAAETRAVG